MDTQETSQTKQLVHTTRLLNKAAFTYCTMYKKPFKQSSSWTLKKPFKQSSFSTQETFQTKQLLQTENLSIKAVFTHNKPFKQLLQIKNLSNKAAFTHRKHCRQSSFYTQKAFQTKQLLTHHKPFKQNLQLGPKDIRDQDTANMVLSMSHQKNNEKTQDPETLFKGSCQKSRSLN